MSYTENKRVNFYINDQLNTTSATEYPVAMLIAGQPGAGKGSVEEYLKNELNQNSITIDPDKMRQFHPDQERLQQENDKTAASYTHEDASRWAEKLRDLAIENRRNIIIDGTLKSPEKAENLCKMISEKGYRVEVHAVAVNELQSKLGIVDRYEEGKSKLDENGNGYGRWVPEDVHDEAYSGMVKSVGLIENKKLADAVCVHTREDKFIYENKRNEKGEYSQEKPHAVEKITHQREKEFSKEEQEKIEKSIAETESLMDKRNAPQEDKNYLSSLSLSIETKIIRDEMRSMAKDTREEINKNLEHSHSKNNQEKQSEKEGLSL